MVANRRCADIRAQLDLLGTELREPGTQKHRRDEITALCPKLHEEMRVRAELEARAAERRCTAPAQRTRAESRMLSHVTLSTRQALKLAVNQLLEPAPEATKEEKDAQKEAMIARSAPGSPLLVRSGSPGRSGSPLRFARSGSPLRFARSGSLGRSGSPSRSESPLRKAFAKARIGKSSTRVPGQENATLANA